MGIKNNYLVVLKDNRLVRLTVDSSNCHFGNFFSGITGLCGISASSLMNNQAHDHFDVVNV